MAEYPEFIVSLNDSQILRFIDELNGVDSEERNRKVRRIQRTISAEKKKPKSRERRKYIKSLYQKQFNLQFQSDYLCVVMNNDKDYDRANEGFSVNGIKYRRFVGTTGGVKNSVIVYVNSDLYPQLKERLDNGRNKSVEFVPDKLEAYQGLICSGSTPLPRPKGFIVVDDCITHFKDNVILITDENAGEPELKYVDDYEVEHNDSDGFGLMSPEYSRKVNQYFTGNDTELSGMNTRYAWSKGMLYTMDFVEFAEKVAGTYLIKDAWGTMRDVREADVILTVSMLKLWDSYDSWEDYYANCEKYHYQFSTTKTTPEELENIRTTNYQFLQSYELTDDELQELCQPTIDEISGVLGLDYRKSILFLAGFGLNERNVLGDNLENYVKALIIDKELINDSYVRYKISHMIKKKIEEAQRGSIKVNANYAMISGDPYALLESMFGLEVKGLLKAGEIYHKYWLDKGADKVVCFRAPMTCHNNIRRVSISKSPEAQYWFRYIKTASIQNAWDTMCDAMNGSDKDGDTNMITDNPVLVKNTKNLRTIVCVQRKAEKKIPTEQDFIISNKRAFRNKIGEVTNKVTGMFEVQSNFADNTPEYKTLEYRIMCGQHYQQCAIDAMKGIIAEPMPSYWYSIRDNIPEENDSIETVARKNFNRSISAAVKPYFMMYVYPQLKTDYRDYQLNSNRKVRRQFGKQYGIHNIKELKAYPNKTTEMLEFLDYYKRFLPVGDNPCTINRISWLFEDIYKNKPIFANQRSTFDYTVLKSGVQYSRQSYAEILKIYEEYKARLDDYQKKVIQERIDDFANQQQQRIFKEYFKYRCESVCPNEQELCDIILDICYKTNKTKAFCWDICGETIVNNLLKKSDNLIIFPKSSTEQDSDFEYCGQYFKMTETRIDKNDNT